jgi:hypothetical protein
VGGVESTVATLGLAVLAGAVRGAVLLGAASLAARLLRRRAAALRHAVWAAALGAHLLLPALSLALPGSILATPAGTPAVLQAVLSGAPPVSSARSHAKTGSAAPLARPRGDDADPTHRGAPAIWTAVWAAGAGVLLVRGAAARRALRRLARAGRPLTAPRWRALAGAAAADLGLRRPVTLLRGAALTVPVTWGVRLLR